MHIGFIGLGHMGLPMAQNILKAGYTLTAYDLSPSPLQAITHQGAIPAHSLEDVAKNADIIITMLQTGEQVKDVCLPPNGLFAHMKKDAIYIDSSSIDIVTTRELHARAEQMHIAMLDAPVSGGTAAAAAGTLTFMIGGDEKNFLRAQSIIGTMAKKIVHAGGPGSGQAAKICNNLILGISMIAVSEGFSLGKKLGLDPKKFFEISSNASGQCWSMTQYCPEPGIIENAPSNNHYQPGFMAKMMLKDLRLGQHAAEMANANIPLGIEAAELYAEYVDQGCGETDFSGIINMISGNIK